MTWQSRDDRYRRLCKVSRGPFPALTIRLGRRYLADYPEDGPAWLLVGIALVGLARYEEAEQAIAKALEFYPEAKRQWPLAEFGHLFQELGDHDQAADWFRQAIEAAPEDATFPIYLGTMLARQGRFQEAEEAHRAAIECPEGCIDEAYLKLGFVLRARERFAEAAECFRQAIRLDPNYKLAHRALRDVERCLKLDES